MLSNVLLSPQGSERAGRSRAAVMALLRCWGFTNSEASRPSLGIDYTRSSMLTFSALEIAFIAAIDPSRFPASI